MYSMLQIYPLLTQENLIMIIKMIKLIIFKHDFSKGLNFKVVKYSVWHFQTNIMTIVS